MLFNISEWKHIICCHPNHKMTVKIPEHIFCGETKISFEIADLIKTNITSKRAGKITEVKL